MLRKLSKFTICAFAFFGMYGTAWSQINVTATAGTATATYTTLKGAFDKINDGTHQGAINISVTGNTTETAAAVLNGTGTGSASYTSVVVKPATGATPIITGNIAAAMVDLNGASNVVIDGSNVAGGITRDLSIINTSTNNVGTAIRFINGASNDTLKNCIIKGSSNGSNNNWTISASVISIATSTAATGNNNILIDNNRIDCNTTSTRPEKSIFILGTAGKENTNIKISRNIIVDFSFMGCFVSNNANEITFDKNELYQTVNQTNGEVHGIVLMSTNIGNTYITRNNIHDLRTTSFGLGSPFLYVTGILINEIRPGATAHVSNNMISLYARSATYLFIFQVQAPDVLTCLANFASAGNVEIYNNSFLVYGFATILFGEGYALTHQGPSTADIKNNIFRNTRTGGDPLVNPTYFCYSATNLTSDYNNISYVPGSTSTGNWTAATAITLANFQALSGTDANSNAFTPNFYSNTNLHLIDSSNCALHGAGTPLASITDDYDNDPRNTPPTIGADEFTNTFVVTPGPDQTICNSVTTATISASNTRGTGIWTLVSGSGTIVNPTSNTTDVTNISTGVNVFQWTVTGPGTCKDSVRVEVKYGTTDPVVTLEAIPNAPVCSEDTVYFIATVTPSATNNYVWRRNNVVFGGSTRQIPVTNFTNGDQITVTVTVTGNQCISTTPQTSAPYTVSVLPAPVINIVPNQGSICKGDSILLTAAGANTYQWLQDGATILNATSNTYKAHIAGNYTVIGKDQCYGRSNPVNIQIIDSPTPTIVANGEYVATDVIYESYQWYLNGNPIPGANSYLLQATQTGNYSVCVTLNGCLACTEVKRVSVGINDIDLNGLTVYPNPASDKVYIRSAENVNVVLASLDGKEVIKENNARELNIGHLSKGIYIMRIYNSRNTLIGIQKIIKS